MDLKLYRTKWALAFVVLFLFIRFLFLATCVRLSRSHSAFDSTLNSSIVSCSIATELNRNRGTYFKIRTPLLCRRRTEVPQGTPRACVCDMVVCVKNEQALTPSIMQLTDRN